MVFGSVAAKNKKNLILELLAKNILNLMEIYFNGIGYWSGRIPRNFILRTNTFLSSRFKSFGSSRNSLNPTLRPNLRPNSDDSLCHVIDSCEILGST